VRLTSPHRQSGKAAIANLIRDGSQIEQAANGGEAPLYSLRKKAGRSSRPAVLQLTLPTKLTSLGPALVAELCARLEFVLAVGTFGG
jgi:hypothetical protein